MTTFALVHGAWHDHTCWEPTAALLREAGHAVVAVDLPCDDPTAGLTEYAATVVDALAGCDDDVVVVGHSLGGLTAVLVADARPARELVLLCAFVPVPGISLRADQSTRDTTFAPEWPALAARQVSHEDGSSSWPADAAVEAFYHDCPPELAASAAAALRPQHFRLAGEPCPLTAYPDVAARAIVCTEDRVLNAEECARQASTRLHAEVIRLGGGHSPMLAQPRTLADALLAPLA
jgi:pimeloyl-ACP methyl ester carboxylesterase